MTRPAQRSVRVTKKTSEWPSKKATAAAAAAPRAGLLATLQQSVLGQVEALDSIVPYVEIFQAGFGSQNRPAGVFLLLGPTGTGKTRTVEALAEALHGSQRNVLKIECGEYQMEHEVAKLIGAPPGYLGHRETSPVLTQQKLTAVTSDKCGISLVLFDEVEKAAPTVHRMLLGIMDRGSIRTGENQPVSFEKSMIFLTSNLGAQEANRDLAAYGLAPAAPFSHTKRESVSIAACKRRFSPEFMNRLDSIVVYQRLTTQALTEIVELELRNIDFMIAMRGAESFRVTFSQASKDFLLAHGTSAEYGARELKRVIHRNVTQRLARLLATGELAAGDAVLVDAGAEALTFRVRRSRAAL